MSEENLTYEQKRDLLARQHRSQERRSALFGMSAGGVPTLAVIGLLAGSLYGCPKYNVWTKEMSGRAAYAEAEQNRAIAVLEATARRDSATMNADARALEAEGQARAEVIRARGTSEANEIIADGLGGPEGYLRYLYINQLSTNGQNVIYIPTEAGLPILEAGRRPAPTQ